jgi:hypothetical protein
MPARNTEESMAKQKHWEVPTAFRVHGEDAGEAQRVVEKLVGRFLDPSGEKSGVVLVTVHRAKRLRGPSDNCAQCKAS